MSIPIIAPRLDNAIIVMHAPMLSYFPMEARLLIEAMGICPLKKMSNMKELDKQDRI